MTADELAALGAIAQAIVAFATLATTIVIAVLVYLGGRKFSRLQHDQALREAWNTLDTIVLTDNELLVIADELMPPKPTPNTSIPDRKRKWFTYLVLNAILARFLAMKADATPLDHGVEFHLKYLLLNDDVYKLTQESGYEEPFANFCKKLREEADAQQMGSV